jgi:oligosaccharide repeat unit polymerase
MTDDFSLKNPWLWGNMVICAVIAYRCYRARDPIYFWSPALFIAAIYFYYVIVGPWVTFEFGSGIDRGIDMRGYCGPAWLGSLIGLVAWLTGYGMRALVRRRERPMQFRPPLPLQQLWWLALGLNIVGLACFAIVAGADFFRLLNPFVRADEPTGAGYTGIFFNYFALAVNFLIPGCAIILLVRLKGHGRWLVVLAWILVASGIFVTLGFRYRLVLLGSGIAFAYYLHRRARPNFIAALLVATIFVTVMGEIGATRRYGLGLDLRQRNASWTESLLGGFGEAAIFATSGAVLEHVPSERGYVGWEPFKQTLLLPIPAQLLPGKNTNEYLIETLVMIYGEQAYIGAAYMFFAEAYLAFGWPGLVVAHLVLGWLCHWLWRWYLGRQHDPLALLVYASAVPYIYVIFSRGYLPQTVMLFFFSVAPAIVLYWWPRQPRLVSPVRPRATLAVVAEPDEP